MIFTAAVLTVLSAAAIIGIGLAYLVRPMSIAPGFGVTDLPDPGSPFFAVKGVRDVMSGLVPLVLLAHGDHVATGIALLAIAVVPLGDMLTILGHHGRTATAFGVHGATALVVAATGVLWLVG